MNIIFRCLLFLNKFKVNFLLIVNNCKLKKEVERWVGDRKKLQILKKVEIIQRFEARNPHFCTHIFA